MSLNAWAATILGVAYIILAIRNKKSCFYFGLASALFWAYESYFVSKLRFDGMIQIFYAVMSLWGLYSWNKKGENQVEKPITAYNSKHHLLITLGGILVSALLIYLSQYFDSISQPVLDAITTVFLVIGTLLLVERKLYSWIYLVVCDIALIYVYYTQSLWLFMIMMVLYTILGTVGYINWRRIYLGGKESAV